MRRKIAPMSPVYFLLPTSYFLFPSLHSLLFMHSCIGRNHRHSQERSRQMPMESRIFGFRQYSSHETYFSRSPSSQPSGHASMPGPAPLFFAFRVQTPSPSTWPHLDLRRPHSPVGVIGVFPGVFQPKQPMESTKSSIPRLPRTLSRFPRHLDAAPATMSELRMRCLTLAAPESDNPYEAGRITVRTRHSGPILETPTMHRQIVGAVR